MPCGFGLPQGSMIAQVFVIVTVPFQHLTSLHSPQAYGVCSLMGLDQARMLMEECEVVGCSLPSVLLSGTSEAEILRCRVSNHGGAAGMHIRSGSTARVVESEVSNCGKAGIFINGAGASAEVEKCHLSKNKFASLEISHSARARSLPSGHLLAPCCISLRLFRCGICSDFNLNVSPAQRCLLDVTREKNLIGLQLGQG
mmetsp:Transcript_4887/g.7856  ORF Transcript_4887/g.7856 Transcript_4887/m.7856 type:complete len:199 (-) Transcript_4887:331-927(-)